MNNIDKYNKGFIESFGINEEQLNDDLAYQSIVSWDSIGHMSLMTTIEEEFGITLEIDDIINFSSYNIGKDILAKYGVTL